LPPDDDSSTCAKRIKENKGRYAAFIFVAGSIHIDPIERFLAISGVLSRLLAPRLGSFTF
jgi:hypothetical protein